MIIMGTGYFSHLEGQRRRRAALPEEDKERLLADERRKYYARKCKKCKHKICEELNYCNHGPKRKYVRRKQI